MDKEINKNNLDTIMACRYCPMCRHVCSSEFMDYRESNTPRGRAILLYNIYKGGKNYDTDTVEAIYNCFLCGCCKSWCQGYEEGGYDIPELIKFARRDIINRNMEPVIVKRTKDLLLSKGNIYGIEKSKSFTADFDEKEAEILYYAGQDINFKNHEIAGAIVNIFNKIGLNYTILKDEPETGKVLLLLGYEKEFGDQAADLYKRIRKSGCKTIVTSDPLAYDSFKNDYPGYGFRLEPDITIKHVSEFLYELSDKDKIKFKEIEKIVTLVDSEYLGRYNSVFKAPRALINMIPKIEFKEIKWNKQEMLATGESAFYFNNSNIDIGRELGEEIYRMAFDINADIIITLSATARNNIRKSSQNGIIVMDIAEFVMNSMV